MCRPKGLCAGGVAGDASGSSPRPRVELGHGGEATVRSVYGHLGMIRHRSAAFEYRVEQHRAVLGERLERLSPALPVALPSGAGA